MFPKKNKLGGSTDDHQFSSQHWQHATWWVLCAASSGLRISWPDLDLLSWWPSKVIGFVSAECFMFIRLPLKTWGFLDQNMRRSVGGFCRHVDYLTRLCLAYPVATECVLILIPENTSSIRDPLKMYGIHVQNMYSLFGGNWKRGDSLTRIW